MKPLLLLLPALVLSGCHSMPRATQPTVTVDRVQVEDDTAPPPAAIDVPNPDVSTLQNEAPPCLSVPAESKPAPRRRAPAAVHKAPAQLEAAAPTVASVGGEPTVKPIANISLSVLGKKVRGTKGEELGRLVDILADDRGRVRVAIIESGGFLGVGNRRVAVDWSLLKFHPDSNDSYVMLAASAQDLQGTPEYKDSHQPVALMAPNDSPPSANEP
jgi:hypothetical protein